MITTLFTRQRRSLENPKTPLSDPDAWLIDALGGGRALSGVHVNAESALTYSAVWRAVNLIARDVAKLPLFIYQRMGESGKRRAMEHPASPLVRTRVNPYMDVFQFRLTLQAQALLRGNGYAKIDRNGSGAPVALWPQDASRVHTEWRGPNKDRLVYVVRTEDNRDDIVQAENMIHIRGLGDGYNGMSVVAKARESLGLGMAAQRYGAAFFGNSARPSAALEYPETMDADVQKRLKQSWNEIHQGVENAHRLAIFENGGKLNTYGMSNEDAQFLGTRQFEVREVANWFGTPPHKLGDTTRTAYASLEQENQAYLDDALDPWLVTWETEFRLKLLSVREVSRDSHLIEFVRQALVRANIKDRGAFYNLGISGGWLSRDEVRARENLNPIPDGEGEKFFVPLNMSLTGEEPEDPEDEEDEAPDPDEVRAAFIGDTVSRMAKRVSDHAAKAARNPDGFIPWIEAMDADHRRHLEKYALPMARVMRCDVADIVSRVLGRYRDGLMEATNVTPEKFKKAVEAACNRIEKTLPAEMAREIMEASNGKAISRV